MSADYHICLRISQFRQRDSFIHTYKCDGNPLPSFEGEPKLVDIPDDMDAFTELSVEQPRMQITKFLSLYAISISQQEHMRQKSSTRIK